MDLWLFVRRISLSATAIALTLILCATVLYLGEAWPGLTFLDCLVRALYMMTMEGVDPPRTWYLELLVFIMPLMGIVFAAEGLVGATVLFLNKSRRQGEWSAVVAATYSGHTVICGLGQLGGTICQGLIDAGRKVVGVEIDEDLPAVVTARRRGVPVVIGDMAELGALREANVEKACCVIVCSGNDLFNIEAAIAAKEMNPGAKVFARVFKKSFSDKINAALKYDIITFSPYATAAETILSQINGAANAPDQPGQCEQE
ncbi:MAG: NAD-binding protein [Armatimonadetes bacterium]|nr:NAD-binding protein [Armatimonadota bacterium]